MKLDALNYSQIQHHFDQDKNALYYPYHGRVNHSYEHHAHSNTH